MNQMGEAVKQKVRELASGLPRPRQEGYKEKIQALRGAWHQLSEKARGIMLFASSEDFIEGHHDDTALIFGLYTAEGKRYLAHRVASFRDAVQAIPRQQLEANRLQLVERGIMRITAAGRVAWNSHSFEAGYKLAEFLREIGLDEAGDRLENAIGDQQRLATEAKLRQRRREQEQEAESDKDSSSDLSLEEVVARAAEACGVDDANGIVESFKDLNDLLKHEESASNFYADQFGEEFAEELFALARGESDSDEADETTPEETTETTSPNGSNGSEAFPEDVVVERLEDAGIAAGLVPEIVEELRSAGFAGYVLKANPEQVDTCVREVKGVGPATAEKIASAITGVGS